MNLLYPAKFKRQPDGGYSVQFVDLPEAITEGDTFDDAMLHAREVLSMSLRGRIDDGKAIPLPSVPKGRQAHLVAPVVQV